MALIKRNSVLHCPMVHQVKASKQACPCWSTWHTGCDVVAEGQAFPAKAIKIGSFEEGVATLRPHQVGIKSARH